MSNIFRKAAQIFASLAMIASVAQPSFVPVMAEGEGQGTGGSSESLNAPSATKTLTPNNDGTYKLSLSVTGSSVASTTKSKANVTIVFDSSGSMNQYTGRTVMVQDDTYGNYTSDGKQLYYYYEGGLFYSEGYYPIYDNSYSRYTTVYYEDENGGFQEYTGARYSKQSRSETRLDVAKQAVNSLIDTLMANNTADNSDAIEMTFVDFFLHVG